MPNISLANIMRWLEFRNPQEWLDLGAGEMAPWVEEIVTKPDDLSLALRTHMLERENRFLQVVL